MLLRYPQALLVVLLLVPLQVSDPCGTSSVDPVTISEQALASAATQALHPLSKSGVELPRWLIGWVNLAHGAAKLKGLDLNVFTDGNPSSFNIIKELGLEKRIIWEPIHNAVKYTITGHITLIFGHKRSEAIFQVLDTGIGLTVGEKRLIWQAGYRGLRAASMEAWGIGGGLGMASLREAVEKRLEGQVTAESPGPGRGTTVTVRFIPRAS